MKRLTQSFVIEIFSELDLARKVEEVFLAMRSRQLLQSQIDQVLLIDKIGQLKSFVEKSFIKVESNLYNHFGTLRSEAKSP
jgi:hypothetical protein